MRRTLLYRPNFRKSFFLAIFSIVITMRHVSNDGTCSLKNKEVSPFQHVYIVIFFLVIHSCKGLNRILPLLIHAIFKCNTPVCDNTGVFHNRLTNCLYHRRVLKFTIQWRYRILASKALLDFRALASTSVVLYVVANFVFIVRIFSISACCIKIADMTRFL